MTDTRPRAVQLIDKINCNVIHCTDVLTLVENDACQNPDITIGAIYAVDNLLCQVTAFAEELDNLITKMKNAGKLMD